jgi:hypothetical protein
MSSNINCEEINNYYVKCKSKHFVDHTKFNFDCNTYLKAFQKCTKNLNINKKLQKYPRVDIFPKKNQ